MTEKGGKQKLWTQDEAATAAELWQRHFVDQHGEDHELPRLDRFRYQIIQRIAATLKRSYDSIEFRLNSQGITFGSMQPSARRASPQQMAERLARQDAENRQSPTSRLLGDPPPGYSALDQRNMAEARR
jgi:hypothetical protein